MQPELRTTVLCAKEERKQLETEGVTRHYTKGDIWLIMLGLAGILQFLYITLFIIVIELYLKNEKLLKSFKKGNDLDRVLADMHQHDLYLAFLLIFPSLRVDSNSIKSHCRACLSWLGGEMVKREKLFSQMRPLLIKFSNFQIPQVPVKH